MITPPYLLGVMARQVAHYRNITSGERGQEHFADVDHERVVIHSVSYRRGGWNAFEPD